MAKVLEKTKSTKSRGVAQGAPKKERVESSPRPIWQRIQQRVANISATELDALPRDGAEQHDHYLYASPKKAQS